MRSSTGIFVVACSLLSIINAQLTWNNLQAGGKVPGARSGAQMVYDRYSNSLYMFGGWPGVDNYVWRYDVAAKEWSIHLNTTDAPNPRKYAYFGLIRYGGDLTGDSLFVTSHGFGAEEYDDTWVYNIRTRTWTEMTTDGPKPTTRYGGHFGVFNNSLELWFGGGFTFTTTPFPTRYIDTYKLKFSSPTAGTWIRVHDQPSIGNQFNPLVPHGRCLQSSSVVEEEKIVLWGGCMRGGNGGGPCPADDSWYFDNEDQSWTELPRCASPRVWGGMAPLTSSLGKALLYGGSDSWSGQVISVEEWPQEEVLIVDVNDNSWTRYMTNGSEYPIRRYDHVMAAAPNDVIYMFGGKRLTDDTTLNDLWVISGDPADTETIDCTNGYAGIHHIHGLFMWIAFGVLFPTGFFVARFFRCKGTGKASKVWFICHVIIQLSALVITIPAFVIIFFAGASLEPTHPHAMIGIILMFLMIIQPINGILRPHIKKSGEKSLYRIIWEWFHRCYGIFVILVGLTQVSLGVFLIVPPRPVWIIWILMLFAWVISFTVLEVIRCVRVVCFADPDSSSNIEMKNRSDRRLSSFNNYN